MVGKTSIALVVGVLFLNVFCGCISESEPSFEINNYKFKHDNGRCIVEASVSGEADCEVGLIKNASEVDSKTITERQLEDGKEIVGLELTNNYETPSGGNFSIAVYHEDNQMASMDFVKAGVDINITNFEPTFESYGNTKYLTEGSITYVNDGDLPAYISEISYSAMNDTFYTEVGKSYQYIAPGEEATLWGNAYLEVTGEKNTIFVFLSDANGKQRAMFMYLEESD